MYFLKLYLFALFAYNATADFMDCASAYGVCISNGYDCDGIIYSPSDCIYGYKCCAPTYNTDKDYLDD
ncbi:hypothetical protein FQR65_LT04698 [Abscondita terminalis]|nr:hypothetical protein FQR65_LT04698 [Abscondita terminalis]